MNKTRLDQMLRWDAVLAVLILAAALIFARLPEVSAEMGIAPWSAPEVVAKQLPDAVRPALAFTSDGGAHAVWQTDSSIFYASQSASGGAWSEPIRLVTGLGPVIKATSDGDLHVLFANHFMGNYDIFHIYRRNGVWSLPINVSRTSGYSGLPTLDVGPDGKLYAAWMDNTPNYWTTYFGVWDGEFWSSVPVPSSRGQAPAIDVAPDGTVYLAWQDRIINPETGKGVFDVLLTQMSNGNWNLPVNMSDNAQIESIGPDLTTTADGQVHLTWVDDNRYVRYAYGKAGLWSYPQTVALAPATARGPRIVSENGFILHLAWDEGNVVRAAVSPAGRTTWPDAQLVAQQIGNMREVTLAVIPNRGIGIGWVQLAGPNNAGVFESWRGPAVAPRLWLPVSFR